MRIEVGIFLCCCFLMIWFHGQGTLNLTNDEVWAQDISEVYAKAAQAAKSGQMEFAFLYYQEILTSDAEPKLKTEALFANGEYFFGLNSFREAHEYFEQYWAADGNLSGRLFALAYLLKIAQQKNRAELIDSLEREIINFEKQSFIFRNYKEYDYQSPLNRRHKAVYFIDRIVIFVEGEEFVKITF